LRPNRAAALIFRCLSLLIALLFATFTQGQTPIPTPAPDSLTPSWETQKQARTYLLSIPPPRGLIVDRNGLPLAQSRVSYNLAIEFPTPLDWSQDRALRFAHEQMQRASLLLRRDVRVSDDLVSKHYKNRGVLPLPIAQDIAPEEVQAFKNQPLPHLVLQPVYQRFYPNGALAGHVIGYAGRTGRALEAPIQDNDPLWPGAEGREGIELTFNEQLSGKMGQLNIAFDATGRKVSEKIAIPPQPGFNVVTTLDENIQRLCEETLRTSCKRGAIVILEPGTGDVLALASWPSLNPNVFIPAISAEAFKALQSNPDIPLLPRAYRSAYPPGSVFKIMVGLAALESGAITREDEFDCPKALEIGNLTFRNWKKVDRGMMNFAAALTESCDTWFYQVGIKVGGAWMADWAFKCGLGAKTGIPLRAEAEGRIPTDDYMRKMHGRKLLDGDLANLSIGQGDTLTTPLQIAQAMGAIANGGTRNQTRLVQQVQTIDNQIVTAYAVRVREQLDIDPAILALIKQAMVAVVSSGNGTAGKAQVENVAVAGKTGTAQWGPKNAERAAAWFAGFAPAENPKYAFAAVYEGDANDHSVHGGSHAAPMIGKVLRELFKDESKPKQKRRQRGRKAQPAETPPIERQQEENGD
jgi:penicillin-binding protein 2